MNEKLFEYRIKYNAGQEHSALDNYHYYMAETAAQAFLYHIEAIKHKHTCVQNISIEKPPNFNQFEARHISDNVREQRFGGQLQHVHIFMSKNYMLA